MIEGYKLHGVTVYTPKQLREELNVSKPLMKFYIQQLVEGVEFIRVSKAQLEAIKADTAGTPLGEIYKKMYTVVNLVTEKGRERLLQRLGKVEADTNVPVPQNHIARVEDIKMTDNKVDGRSLHEFLQIETPYPMWFPRMCEYGFNEGIDFITKMFKTTHPSGRPEINHELTIDMAKELCMIQRNERGKQARLYFIECEKRLKERPMSQLDILVESAKALREQQKRLSQVETEQAKQKQELQDIREVITLRPDSWRDDTKHIIDKIAATLGGDSEAYRDIRNQSYTELEKRAHCRLKQQLKNAKKRMEERGASKTEINSLRILDMIDKNQRLIEIYLSVVKDMAIHHGVTLNTVLF